MRFSKGKIQISLLIINKRKKTNGINTCALPQTRRILTKDNLSRVTRRPRPRPSSRNRQPSSFPRAHWEQRPSPRRATFLSPPLFKLHILNHTDLSSPPNASNSPPNYTLHSLTIVPSSLHEYTR